MPNWGAAAWAQSLLAEHPGPVWPGVSRDASCRLRRAMGEPTPAGHRLLVHGPLPRRVGRTRASHTHIGERAGSGGEDRGATRRRVAAHQSGSHDIGQRGRGQLRTGLEKAKEVLELLSGAGADWIDASIEAYHLVTQLHLALGEPEAAFSSDAGAIFLCPLPPPPRPWPRNRSRRVSTKGLRPRSTRRQPDERRDLAPQLAGERAG